MLYKFSFENIETYCGVWNYKLIIRSTSWCILNTEENGIKNSKNDPN